MESNFSEKNIKSSFQHAIVRDLEWVIRSRSLQVSDFPLPEFSVAFYESFYNEIRDQLIALDQNPKRLEAFVQQKNTRLLGSYFEYLVYFVFEIHPDWSIIDFQHQIHEQGITKGELDFIVKQKSTDKLYHIETAIKFYLANTDEFNENTLWYGPNAKDRLDLKFSKMQQQQIPMIQQSKYKDVDIHSKTWVKGGLFVPVNADENLKCHPNIIGTWCTIDEFKALITGDISHFHILEKKNWLSGLNKIGIGQKAEKKTMSTHFKNKNAFALLLKNQINDSLLFIVDNSYRQKIKPES